METRRILHRYLPGIFLLALIVSGQSFEVLYNFPATATPYGGLVQDGAGNIYGTTFNGGNNDRGGIFRMTSNGVFSTLYSFGSTPNDGQSPFAGLCLAPDGNLYGTTTTGGLFGMGTLFVITPAGTLTTLFPFRGTRQRSTDADGANPYGRLTVSADGRYLLGTTRGGTLDFVGGCLFQLDLTTQNIYTLAAFGGAGGTAPMGEVIPVTGSSRLLTTTSIGGAVNRGTVAAIDSYSPTSLFTFDGTTGDNPQGGVILASDGFVYGTTYAGGANNFGTAFKMTISGSLVWSYSFDRFTGGAIRPSAALVQGNDGNFYGTTAGGASGLTGTIFKVTPAGSLTNIVDFRNTTASSPMGGPLLQAADGRFYGVASAGGQFGGGVLFRFDIPPAIVRQPVSVTWPVGGSVTLSATLGGSGPSTYQWQKNSQNIPQATSSNLVLNPLQFSDAADYRLIVSNVVGSVVSDAATLTVIPRPAFQSIALAGGNISTIWSTVAGQKYELQSTSSPDLGNWSAITAITNATGPTVTSSGPLAPPFKYFRVRWVP